MSRGRRRRREWRNGVPSDDRNCNRGVCTKSCLPMHLVLVGSRRRRRREWSHGVPSNDELFYYCSSSWKSVTWRQQQTKEWQEEEKMHEEQIWACGLRWCMHALGLRGRKERKQVSKQEPQSPPLRLAERETKNGKCENRRCRKDDDDNRSSTGMRGSALLESWGLRSACTHPFFFSWGRGVWIANRQLIWVVLEIIAVTKKCSTPAGSLKFCQFLINAKFIRCNAHINSRVRSNVMDDAHWLSMHAYQSSKIPTSITLRYCGSL